MHFLNLWHDNTSKLIGLHSFFAEKQKKNSIKILTRQISKAFKILHSCFVFSLELIMPFFKFDSCYKKKWLSFAWILFFGPRCPFIFHHRQACQMMWQFHCRQTSWHLKNKTKKKMKGKNVLSETLLCIRWS